MPTLIKFSAGQQLKVAEDFHRVKQQLSQAGNGVFNRLEADRQVRVAVFVSTVAYVEEAE